MSDICPHGMLRDFCGACDFVQREEEIARLRAERDALREALEELCDIVDAHRGAGDIDSFTTQPARAALALAKGGDR